MPVRGFSAMAGMVSLNPLIWGAEGRAVKVGLGCWRPLFAKGKSRYLSMGQELRQQPQQRCRACVSLLSDGTRTAEARSGSNFTVPRAEDAVTPRKSSLVVVSFYKFAELPDYVEMRSPLRTLCDVQDIPEGYYAVVDSHVDIDYFLPQKVSGGVIIAPEGINGSICGTPEAVEKVFDALQADHRLSGLRRSEAPATEEEEDLHHGHTEKSPLGAGDDAPFRWGHVRVKLKSEVVPLGIPGVNPAQKVGTYVKPKDWNALISDPRTVVVDVRNDYEVRIGKFKGAVDPMTQSFREFPAWVEQRFGLLTASAAADLSNPKSDAVVNEDDSTMKAESAKRERLDFRSPRIAMYCTGGIRCEKATSFLMEKGLEEVYHLEGGILKYLEEVPPADSLWEGECFVFDKRVSVDHRLKQGTHSLCYACKKPVTESAKSSPLWEEGISCPFCFSSRSQEEKDRARARQTQFVRTGLVGGPGNGKPEIRRKS